MVKEGKEATLWAEVTPEMMSDEEQEEDYYMRHPPSYRSKALHQFITKLDTRLDKEKGTHPRMERRLGSPIDKAIPSRFKKWTIRRELWEDDATGEMSPTCSSDSEINDSEMNED